MIWGLAALFMVASGQLLRVVEGETLRIHVPETLQHFPESLLQQPGHYLLLDSTGQVVAETVITPGSTSRESRADASHPPAPPVRTERLPVLAFLLFFGGFYFWQVHRARSGRKPWLRPIAGLQALDDAVGRSTEMGRPILFIPGMTDIDSLATIAALSVLKYVGKKAALYELPVIVPLREPMVMAAAQEILKEAYTEAGRPDLYDEDRVYFTTTQQFGYASTVAGTMMREKPGAIFLMGHYYAESLIMAETGNTVGAIQIAGTAATDQLPFFIAACDYVLIGEEFYAASAYLSQSPDELATIKAEDYVKIFYMLAVVIGSLLEGLGIHVLKTLLEVKG